MWGEVVKKGERVFLKFPTVIAPLPDKIGLKVVF